MGEQAKTIEYRFGDARPHEARSMTSRVYRGETDDYARAEGNEKSHPRNQKEKSRKRLFLFVLFTLHFSLKTRGCLQISIIPLNAKILFRNY